MSKLDHVMVDLETTGTSSEAIILTFGAIRFNPFGDDINSEDGDSIQMDTFYRRVDPSSFDWPNTEVNETTIEWWANQPEAVRQEAFDENDRHDIRQVMADFRQWCDQGKVTTFWANGPQFDYGILDNVNEQISRGNPWKYWQISDARTIYKIVHHTRPEKAQHHALWDCWSQIVALQDCFRQLNVTSFPPSRT